MHKVSEMLRDHYAQAFRTHGATSEGVDWGRNQDGAACRYQKMLAVIPPNEKKRVSLLDVGCGYGALLQHAKENDIALAYTGVDVVEDMISEARARHKDASFLTGDILDLDVKARFDYVVCNGILTQKLNASKLEMDDFANRLIRRMFTLCERGVGFNVMTTKVNYFSHNLYYRNPAELFAWCMSELTRHIKLDHAYPLYEYTLYLYRQPVDLQKPSGLQEA
jgi:SAM-dependent methyltransferase